MKTRKSHTERINKPNGRYYYKRCQQHKYINMGKKDVFSKVEADAIEKLEQPETAGAAKTVLEYIAEQRSKTTN